MSKRDLGLPDHFSSEISRLLSSQSNLHHWLSLFSGLKTPTATIPPALIGLLACQLQILGILSFHNYVGQFLMINQFLSLSLFLSISIYSLLLVVFLWRTLTNTPTLEQLCYDTGKNRCVTHWKLTKCLSAQTIEDTQCP